MRMMISPKVQRYRPMSTLHQTSSTKKEIKVIKRVMQRVSEVTVKAFLDDVYHSGCMHRYVRPVKAVDVLHPGRVRPRE
jgi:hypothetical protein